jgi:S1-C subfamily serine protease
MDSPAMKSGLQSGDIIISADGKDMDTYADLLTYINEKNPDDTVRLRAMRRSGNEYVKVPAEAVLSKLK